MCDVQRVTAKQEILQFSKYLTMHFPLTDSSVANIRICRLRPTSLYSTPLEKQVMVKNIPRNGMAEVACASNAC